MQSNQLGPPGGDRGKHNIEMRGNRPGECCLIARTGIGLPRAPFICLKQLRM
jgi:hypothetical protein